MTTDVSLGPSVTELVAVENALKAGSENGITSSLSLKQKRIICKEASRSNLAVTGYKQSNYQKVKQNIQ